MYYYYLRSLSYEIFPLFSTWLNEKTVAQTTIDKLLNPRRCILNGRLACNYILRLKDMYHSGKVKSKWHLIFVCNPCIITHTRSTFFGGLSGVAAGGEGICGYVFVVGLEVRRWLGWSLWLWYWWNRRFRSLVSIISGVQWVPDT